MPARTPPAEPARSGESADRTGAAHDDATTVIPGADALQAAALQMIAAAKAFLDVAEKAVQDPQLLGQVATVVGTVAKNVVGSIGALAGAAGMAGGSSGAGDDDPPLEHITID